jgi:hypothetical protein
MRYVMLSSILLLTSVAFANDRSASCEITKSTIVSLSPAELTQVSNLRLIQVVCSVSARPFPSKPGESQNGLRAETTAYEIIQSGDRKEVPSKADPSGGGEDLKQQREWVNFFVFLPLDPAEREIEARRSVANLKRLAGPGHSDFPWQQLESPQALGSLSDMVSQHRAGHFQIECRVLDGARVVGVNVIEFEVLFEGRFSDSVSPFGYWKTPPPPKTEP